MLISIVHLSKLFDKKTLILKYKRISFKTAKFKGVYIYMYQIISYNNTNIKIL